MMKLSALRQEIWHNLLDIDRYCRYYEIAHARNTRYHLLLRGATLLLIAGVVTPIVGLIPTGPIDEFVRAGLFSLATGFTIWDAIVNFSKRAAIAHAIYINCDRLRVEWRNLWLSVEDSKDVDEAALQQKNLDLAYRSAEVKGWAGANDLVPDGKLNEKTAKDSYEVVATRHKAHS